MNTPKNDENPAASDLSSAAGSDFFVFASVKAGFEPTYKELTIKKGGATITLTHDETVELLATLKGKRGNISSSEMDGYVPVETFLFSQNK